MSDVFGRGGRRTIREDVLSFAPHAAPGASFAAPGAGPAWRQDLAALWRGQFGTGMDAAQGCGYALEAAAEMHFAMDLLEARGDLEPDSPEAEAFVQAYIRDVIVHEVGHTLGLRHNFKASTTVTREQLRDAAFGRTRGISNSVMDYNAFNLPLKGEPRGELNMVGLGAYDLFAIEYGYKPLAPEQEAAELAKIAGRSATDPLLAFADDADAGFGDVGGYDPLVNRFDLGDDPLAWYERRLQLSRELWARVQERGPRAGDDPNRLRRSLLAGFRQIGPLPELASKYIGGLIAERDPQGTPGARPAFRPVDAARQRQALGFVTGALFATDSFRFRPEFLSALQPDYIEWQRSGPADVPSAVLALQTQAMDRLLSPGVAQRLLDLPNYLGPEQRRGALSLNELYTTLQGAVWSELRSGREIEPLRRSLQREHLKRLQALLTRPQPQLPADAVSLARLQATALQGQIRAALGKGGLTVENRAHLQESLALVTEALRASMQRG